TLRVLFRAQLVTPEQRAALAAQQQQAALDANQAAATAAGAAASAPATPTATQRKVAQQGTATSGATMMAANMGALTYSGPSDDGSGATKTVKPKAGAEAKTTEEGSFSGTPESAQCPCGSGKKYKMCHGKNEE